MLARSLTGATAGLGRLCGGRAVGVPPQFPRRGDVRRRAVRADPLRRCAAARRCAARPPAARANPSTAPFRTGRRLAGARRRPMESVKSPALGRTAWRLRQAHMALRCAAPSALSVCALSAAGKMRHVHIGTQLLSLFGHAADACAHLQVKATALGWSLFRRTTSPPDRSRRARAGGRSGGVCLVVTASQMRSSPSACQLCALCGSRRAHTRCMRQEPSKDSRRRSATGQDRIGMGVRCRG